MIKDRKSQRGPIRAPLSQKRLHCVSMRLTLDELSLLDSKRGELQRGEWLRCALLDRLPPIIPELNKQAWLQLSRAASNLNQVAAHMNAFQPAARFEIVQNIDEIRKILAGFRNALLGHFDEGSES